MSKKYSSTCPFAKNEYLPAGAGCFQVDAYCGRTGEKRGKIDPELCQGCIVEKNRRRSELLKQKLDNAPDNKLIKRFSSLDLPKLYGQTKGKLLEVQILDFKKGISPQLIAYLQKQDEFYKDEKSILERLDPEFKKLFNFFISAKLIVSIK